MKAKVKKHTRVRKNGATVVRQHLRKKSKGYTLKKDFSGQPIKVAKKGYTQVSGVSGSRFVKNKVKKKSRSHAKSFRTHKEEYGPKGDRIIPHIRKIKGKSKKSRHSTHKDKSGKLLPKTKALNARLNKKW